ncbi:hypothetical protein GCM10010168_29600 [Actinoplanes ianthinogenes]|uniref:Integral membrane protein n=1 Tax=Actinoplanes ianthinogenes TaxID=122358 RepID=A0ABM7LLG9_9ACTN|nr:hypothetical protein [Actinoplanes ianthinogenes]BCJ40102.1 hypothetical protein Aiant_07590 [Actinoplanes ianthinogenes]GGR10287.1 hypothetical protein GCM10010168_29600 [Actinoplanes ianthinogenes]
MTTESVPAEGDARRLLTEVHGLTRRVRVDQRVTWLALSVLAAVTFIAIPFDYFFLDLDCTPDGACKFDRQGVLYFWPAGLLLAYAVIAYGYTRIARTRGLGTRVLPYVYTGVALAGAFLASWIAFRIFVNVEAVDHPLPSWMMVLDRLIAPWGIIGVALLVLARIERNLGLLLFTLGYLVMVLVPVDFGWRWSGQERTGFLPQQIIYGTVLLLGAIGFGLAARRRR